MIKDCTMDRPTPPFQGVCDPYPRPLRAPRLDRFVTLMVILVPFVGLIAAIISLWGWAFTWVELSLLLGMYFATGFGITIGYHRLFTHRSFNTSRPIKFLLGVLGCMSVQGPIVTVGYIYKAI